MILATPPEGTKGPPPIRPAPEWPHRRLSAIPAILIALVLVMIMAAPSAAHRANESYVYFDVAEDSLTGRFEVALPDLDALLDVDADGDGTVTDAEIAASAARVFDFLSQRLTLEHGGRALGLEPADLRTLDAMPVAVFAQIGFRVTGLESVPGEITVRYDPLTAIGPDHAGFVLIGSNARTGLEENEAYISLAFYGGDEGKRLSLAGEPWLAVLRVFLGHGFKDFLLGADHLLFLLALLLTSVMTAAGGRWVAEENLGNALWNVAGIVAIYALGHSIALNMGGLGLFNPPAGAVGALVALSVVVVALMNLIPGLHRHLLPILFGFGLVHGFAFAQALRALPPAPDRQAVGLAGFNIGVELGQAAVVVLAFPILWLVRRLGAYRLVAVRLGSAAMILLAGTLLLERTTDFDFDARATLAMLTGIEL